MPRERWARQSLGPVQRKIKEARILIVGAGGIGCELLKNVVLVGYGEVHIVDLDTIDLSNLNRQFLFRKEHIKRPKANVAKETAEKFNPHVKIEAHHDDIKNPRWNVAWFESFDIVFNALDNLDARRHVNKMCLAANRPLIESGTTGFNGQVQVILKGKTECYDCNAKETPKTYPVCTIRSTPSQPIHCVVWAKSYLFVEIFGPADDNRTDFDHSEDAENAGEIEELENEARALKTIRDSTGTVDFSRKVFDKVYSQDIERLRGMEDMWKHRRKPDALNYEQLLRASADVASNIAEQDQNIWTDAENFAVFVSSAARLGKRSHASDGANGDSATFLFFDKDDDDALDFVTSSSNLRSSIFGIQTKSKFEVKQMAGNIIPAIATTNAMTAGLCVLQALKVLRDDLDKAKMIFLERPGARVINSEALRPPNPDCSVCGVTYAQLSIDSSRAKLRDLVEHVLRGKLKYADFAINNNVGTVYDPDLEDNLDKSFEELGLAPGNFLSVIDDADEEPRVNLVLFTVQQSFSADETPLSILGGLDIPKRPQKPSDTPESRTNGVSNGTNGHDPAQNNGHDTSKRKRSASIDEVAPKKVKAVKADKTSPNDDTIVVDDGANDGSIVIEDD